MSRDELTVLVREQAERITARDGQITALATRLADMIEANEHLAGRLARVEHLLSRNSQNSSSPPSKDDEPGQPAPRERKRRGGGGPKREPGQALRGVDGKPLSRVVGRYSRLDLLCLDLCRHRDFPGLDGGQDRGEGFLGGGEQVQTVAATPVGQGGVAAGDQPFPWGSRGG